jgi:hypothetical protein
MKMRYHPTVIAPRLVASLLIGLVLAFGLNAIARKLPPRSGPTGGTHTVRRAATASASAILQRLHAQAPAFAAPADPFSRLCDEALSQFASARPLSLRPRFLITDLAIAA